MTHPPGDTDTTECSVREMTRHHISHEDAVRGDYGPSTVVTLDSPAKDTATRYWMADVLEASRRARVAGLGGIFDVFTATTAGSPSNAESNAVRIGKGGAVSDDVSGEEVTASSCRFTSESPDRVSSQPTDTMVTLFLLAETISKTLCKEAATHKKLCEWFGRDKYKRVCDPWSSIAVSAKIAHVKLVDEFQAAVQSDIEIVDGGGTRLEVSLPSTIYQDPALTVALLEQLRAATGFGPNEDVPTQDLANRARAMSWEDHSGRRLGAGNVKARHALSSLLLLRCGPGVRDWSSQRLFDENTMCKAIDDAKAIERRHMGVSATQTMGLALRPRSEESAPDDDTSIVRA